MSEWRERANRRRDERHTASDIRPPGGSKKDTKKWCRGVVGREHKPVCRDYGDMKGFAFKGWKNLACTECGKVLDRYWPSSFFKSDKPVPDWVR